MTKSKSPALHEIIDTFSEISRNRILSLDFASLTIYRLLESFDTLILRGRYRLGECWHLKKTLEKEYNIDIDNPYLEEYSSPEEIIDTIINANEEVAKLVH